VVKVTIGWGGKFECAEANIIKGFVVNAEYFICRFDELVNGECAVVWLYDCV
jgi:hypothetical protein